MQGFVLRFREVILVNLPSVSYSVSHPSVTLLLLHHFSISILSLGRLSYERIRRDRKSYLKHHMSRYWDEEDPLSQKAITHCMLWKLDMCLERRNWAVACCMLKASIQPSQSRYDVAATRNLMELVKPVFNLQNSRPIDCIHPPWNPPISPLWGFLPNW